MRLRPKIKFFLFLVLLFVSSGVETTSADDARWLAHEQILLYGLSLQAEPAHQVVPKDIATIVSTYLQAPDTIPEGVLPIPADAEVRATLRGPSLPGPVELVTRVNAHFEISPLQRAGLHTLENIRIVRDGEVVLYATPESVTIDVIDQLLVTEIMTRALTAEEIKDYGIIFDPSNFQAYNFTAAFAVEPGEQIQLDFPVLLSRLETATDVTVEAVSLPGLSGPGLKTVATIVPDTLKLAQTKIPNLSVKTFTFDIEEVEQLGFEIAPIIGTIVIPGDIGFLNHYFSIMLMAGNAAPEGSGLYVQDLTTEIILPPGNDDIVGSGDDPLAMAMLAQGEAPRIQPITAAGLDGQLGTADDIAFLPPGGSSGAEFLVEGRREGSHLIEMEITGTLTGLPVGPVTVHGRAAGAVQVRNPAFTLTFTHPDVVNDGEIYDLDITVTNTSTSLANFVSVNLYPQHISGAELVDALDNTREIETILPGDSAMVSFALRSHVTGTVYATTLDSDENVAGRFRLKTSVGELGIPLSPDSLVLPKEAGSLPQDLRQAGVALLGKAYAAATTPAGALPPDVMRFSKQMVWDRAVELAAAGLRYSLHEPLADTAKHLLFDFAGNKFTRLIEDYPAPEQASDLEAAQNDVIGFDDLRRRSFRGDVWAEAIAALLEDDLASMGTAAFHQQWAETVSYRPAHLSVLLTSDSGPLPFNLIIEESQGLQLGSYDADNERFAKEIPFSDYLVFRDAQGQPRSQLAVVAVPQADAYTLKLERIPEMPPGTPVTLSVVLPADTPSGLRQVVFSNVVFGGEIPVVEILPGDAFPVDVTMYDGEQPVAGSDLPPTTMQAINDPAPTVISVVQQAQADIVGCDGTGGLQLGRVVAALFTEAVTAESVQDQYDRIDISHYDPEENEVVAVAQQPGGRIVFLALSDSIGPFVQRQMTISDVEDRRGQVMDAWTGEIEPTITEEGCVISGQVLKADGTPVELADIRLFFDNGNCGWYGVSAKHADIAGSYGWDFALQQRRGKIVALDPLTQESRTVQFDAGRNGQRLNINIVFLGRGNVGGRVMAEDGFTVLSGAEVRVTSLNDYSLYGGRSDDAGRYLITDIPTGSILIEAVHVDSNSQTTQSAVIAVAGETVDKDLVLVSEETRVITAEYGSISGHVLEADGLTPIADVPVIVYYRTGSQEGVNCPDAGPPFWDCPVAFANADVNGAFAFEEVPAGELRVYSFEQARQVSGHTRIQLPADGSETVNVLISGGLATVHGVVLDADGNPVADAIVGGGLSLTTTDAEGRFTLTDVPVGHRMLVAVSEQIGSKAAIEVDLVAEGEEIYATMIMPGVGNVVGTIYQPDGITPVPNLEIYLWEPAQGGGISVVATTMADANGSYSIENVPEGDHYTLSAFLPDMSMGNLVPVSILANGQTVQADVVFVGRGRITGTLVDDDGLTPLQGQVALNELRLVRAGPVGVRFQYTQYARMVETDINTGTFVFDDVFVGNFVLTAAGPFSPHPVLHGGTIPFDGAEVDVVMQLQPTSTITGTVYAPDGVTPAGPDLVVHFRGYKIVCYPDAGCFERPEGIQELTALTDDAGRFVFPLVNAGKFELTVEEESTGEFAQVRGTVVAGAAAEVDLRLLALRDVLVRVWGSDGVSSIAGADVQIDHAVILEVEEGLVNNAGYLAIERAGTADANGEILFAGGDALPEGELVVLAQDLNNGFAGRASVRIVPVDPLDPAPPPVEVDVYLYDAAGSVYGTVFGPDGLTPVENAEVIIANTDGSLAFLVTDAAGEYRFDQIPLGTFEVRVFEAATGRRGIGSGQIFTDGQEVGLNITQAAMGYVTGTLLSARERAPLVGWTVKILQRNPWADMAGPGAGTYTTWRCTTGPDGRFDFAGISLGSFTLIAEKAGDRARLESRITYDGEVLDIPVVVTVTEDPTGTIAGMVYHPNGDPAVNIAVCLQKCPPYGLGTTTDAFGTFRFEDVSLGRYDILAQSQDEANAGMGEVELVYAGETASVSVVLGGVGSISGTVERQDGSSVPNVPVNLGPTPTDLTQNAGPTGDFAFIQLAPGTYTVTVVDQFSGESGSARVVLAPGEDLSVRVVLAPAYEITAQVTFSNAVPAEKIQVLLTHLEAEDPNDAFEPLRLYAETDSDGRFTFKGVPQGQSRLYFDDPLGPGVATRLIDLVADADLGTIALDDTVPYALAVTPINGAADVPLDPTITVTFSEAIDPGSVTPDNVVLTRDTGDAVSGFPTVVNGDTQVAFTLLEALDDEARYTLRIKANPPFDVLDRNDSGTIDMAEAIFSYAVLQDFATYDTDGSGTLTPNEYIAGITDPSGHVMARDLVVSFSTVDITPPTIMTLNPAPDTGGVAVESVVRVTYSEPIDPAEFTGPPIVLQTGGTTVVGAIDFILSNTGIVFTPTFPLAEDSTYQVELLPATDLSGNVEASSQNFTFTTTDHTPPVIEDLILSGGGSVIEGGVGTVEVDVGTAFDVAWVDFYLNGVLVAAEHNAPFVLNFAAVPELGSAGEQILVGAVATDTSGNRGDSIEAQFAITADMSPSVSIVPPATGLTAATGQRVEFQVNATDDLALTHVAYQAVGGQYPAFASVDYDPPVDAATESFAFYVPMDSDPGSVIAINATAVDTKDQQGTADALGITVLDATAPSVAITGLTSGEAVAPGQAVTVVVAAQDLGGISSLIFEVSGATSYIETRMIQPAQDSVVSSFSFSVSAAAAAPETITLNVTAEDQAGNSGSADATVLSVADLMAPTVTIQPQSPTVKPGQELVVTVLANDNVSVTQVDMTGSGAFDFSDTQQVSPPSSSAQIDFTVNIPGTATPGETLRLSTLATDSSGNVSLPATAVVPVGSAMAVTLPPSLLMLAGDTATVTVEISEPAPPGGQLVAFTIEESSLAAVTPSVTIPEGETQATFEIEAFIGGTTIIHAAIDGVPLASMTLTVSGGVVSGQVLEYAGLTPVSGVDLNINGVLTSSVADGLFAVEGVPGVDVSIRAHDTSTQLTGYVTGSMNAPNGFWRDVIVIIMPAGSVTGTVYLPDGVTLAGEGAQIDLFAAGQVSNGVPLQTVFTDIDSRFEFPLVEVGQYEIVASDMDGNRGWTAASIDASGQTIDVPVVYLGRGSVNLTVEDTDGTAVPNATLSFSAYAPIGHDYRTATADLNGSFMFEDVFVGDFTVTATDPDTGLRAVASGAIESHLQQVDITLLVDAWAAVEGFVYRNDGVTPVAGARLLTTGYAWTETDINGAYRFEVLPLGTHLISVFENTTRGIGWQEVTLSVDSATEQVDIDLVAQGTLVVAVEDSFGQTVDGAIIEVRDGPDPQHRFPAQLEATTDAAGQAILPHVNQGPFTVKAMANDLAGFTTGEITSDQQVLNVTVQLEPSATITGTVYGPDGVTPQENVLVRVLGEGGGEQITGPDGQYTITGLKLVSRVVDAYAGGSLNAYGAYTGGLLRARVRDIVLDTNGQIVTQDLVLVGLGTVTGQVFMPAPAGTTAPNMPVTVRSHTPEFGRVWSTQTNAAGFYSVEQVPVGLFTVTAGDNAQQLLGEVSDTVDTDGQAVTIDIVLQSNAITTGFPQVLYDANVLMYGVEESGALGSGTFYQPAGAGIPGASVMDIVTSGSTHTFIGNQIPVQEDLGREIVLRHTDLGGLNVTRKVFVPQAGYFARYLEIVTNPTAAPITFDLNLHTRFRYDAEEIAIITTSSGDTQLEGQGAAGEDLWVVVDDADPNEPYQPPSNRPPVALVWGQTDAPSYPNALGFTSWASLDLPAGVDLGWEQITLAPGEAAAWMHFVVQQASRPGAEASAQRLAAVPPEALSGLSVNEIGMIRNFGLAPDGSSTLAALPPLTGTVSGHVWASDGITPAPPYFEGVYFRSDNIYFGRTFEAGIDTNGRYTFVSDLDNGIGPAIPLDAFTVRAAVPRGFQTYAESAWVSGEFAEGQTAAEVDIVFTTTGMFHGTVTYAAGGVVAGAEITASNPPYSAEAVSESGGAYQVAFLPPGDYQLEATLPHAQGTDITTLVYGSIAAGQTTLLEITLPLLGSISGTVTDPNGLPVFDAEVALRNISGDYFLRSTNTDTGGNFTLTDIPVDTYQLTAFDPDTNGPVIIEITVVADATLTADFQFPVFWVLPVSLFDGDGFLWDIGRDAHVTDSGIPGTTAPAYSTGMVAYINNTSFAVPVITPTAIPENSGRELQIGSDTIDGVRMTRKVYVPEDEPFARYLEILENTTTADVTATLRISSDLGSGYWDTQLVATSDDNLIVDPNDDFVITDDTDGIDAPVTVHLFSGSYAAFEPSAVSLANNDLAYSFEVTVPAGEQRIIMHLASQQISRAEALTIAPLLHCLQGQALTGLSVEEQQTIVNWVPVIDSDCDGLNDEIEGTIGTDVNNPDSDGDGLTDRFEYDNAFNPLVVGEEDDDPDLDGLDNLAEQAAGTLPHNPDTDGDGLQDGFELAYGFDPRQPGEATQDPDDDSLDNLGEQTAGANPLVADTDGDGLSDGDEINLHGTSPIDDDTDNDTLLDGFEVAYGFNPLVEGEQTGDPDTDGLDNVAEQTAGTHPRVSDTDQDELSDGDEVNLHFTEPLNWDTDGGGRSDGGEVLYDGTDPLDPADDLLALRLVNGSDDSDQAATALDQNGNLHMVWTDRRTGNDEIYYMMVDPEGTTLIDDTPLTNDSAASKRPRLVVDSGNRVHVVWHDRRAGSEPEVFYTLIDPGRHAQDGTGGDDAVLRMVDDQMLSADDGNKSSQPHLAVDALNRVSVVWADADLGRIQLVQLDTNGTVLLPQRTLFDAGASRWYQNLPTIAVDGNDQLHIAWRDHLDMSSAEIWYTMVNGASGDTLIDATVVTADDGDDANYPVIAVGRADEIGIVFQDARTNTIEVYMLRLAPVLDDQDGSPADPADIIILPDTMMSPDDGIDSSIPFATMDTKGSIRLTYYDDLSVFSGGRLFYREVDRAGAVLASTGLTQGNSADSLTDWTLGLISPSGITSYVTWTDTRFGGNEVLLRILNADSDQDGLADIDEVTAGTAPDNPDSDGDGLLDGFEVIHGFDPLTPGEEHANPDGDGLDNLAEQSAGTDPNVADTDGDGLSDGDEPLWGADALRSDTDYDSVPDGVEVHTWGSDPTLVDSDGDGMLDGFEVTYSFDPTTAGDEALDADTDGLNNLTEQELGTHPRNADTDADGVSDGDEVNTFGTDPLNPDSDEDGLLDGFEVTYGFDPLTPGHELLDPDNDGLDNLSEQTNGTYPDNPDSDGDLLLDGFEVLYGFNPLVAGETNGDPDTDGLDNLSEQTWNTDPTISDSDWDMLEDGEEVNTYLTDPADWDTDGDGLGDGDEALGNYGYVTDPLLTDTDGGGRSDYEEIQIDGTDPTDPNDDLVPVWITDGAAISDQAAVDVDAAGNSHVVWVDQRTGSEQLFYTMLAPDKSTLIDDTQLTTGTAVVSRPDVSVIDATHIHVVWQDNALGIVEIFHMVINPTADDQDGTSGDPGSIITSSASLASSDDGQASSDAQVASDGMGNVNVVWGDTGDGTIHFAQRASDGSVSLADQTVFSAGGALAWGRALPVVAVDTNDDVHVVWMHRPGTSIELWYAMLDGTSGAVLIAPTQLTGSGGYDERHPSIGVGPGDEVTVVYEGKQNVFPFGVRSYLYMLRTDPGLDDQNGDAANIVSITTLAPKSLFFSSWSDQMLPTTVVDASGIAHCSYFSTYSGDHGTLVFVRFTDTGTQVGSTKALSGNMTATTASDFTRPSLAIHNGQTHIGWTDDQRGSAEVMLNVMP